MAHEEGRQLYGTQFYANEKGETALRPVIDPKNLDTRRAEMGMEPFDRYLRVYCGFYKIEPGDVDLSCLRD